MKPRKDIFDLFRESDDKLAERPSGQSWSKLERRLDRHRRRHQHSNQRLLGMVAGVLLLIGIIGILSVLTDQKVQEQVAEADPEFQLEDLKTDGDGTEVLKVIEFSHQHQDRLAIPIEEGSADKKLVATQQKLPNFNKAADETDSIRNFR